MKRLTGLVLCSGLLWCGSSWGSDLPSLEKGKQLFNSEKLGTSGKSCASCHPADSKFRSAATEDDQELADIINRCIAGPLKGVRLDPDGTAMKSLMLYLKSRAGTAK